MSTHKEPDNAMKYDANVNHIDFNKEMTAPEN